MSQTRLIVYLLLMSVLVLFAQDTYLITANTDDGQEIAGSWTDNGTTISVGLAGGSVVHCATRFLAINTTAGLVVTTATLRLNFESSNGTATNFHAKLLGDDVDDCAALGTTHRPTSGWTDTAATLDYDPSSYPSADTFVEFNVATIIQEILDRAGWATGNDICLAVKDDTSGANTSMAFEALDNIETDEPELVLTLTTASTAIKRRMLSNLFKLPPRSETWSYKTSRKPLLISREYASNVRF